MPMLRSNIVSILSKGLPITVFTLHLAILVGHDDSWQSWRNIILLNGMISVIMITLTILLRYSIRHSLMPFQLQLMAFLSLPGTLLAVVISVIQPRKAGAEAVGDETSKVTNFRTNYSNYDAERDKKYQANFLIPYQDYMDFGTVWEKQRAIAIMARFYRPEYLPILRKATQDVNNAIRVHAATALARIEDNFVKRKISLERHYLKHPSDPVAIRELAAFYYDYMTSGLLEEALVLHTGFQALQLYTRALVRHFDLANVYSLGLVWLRLGQPQQAAICLERVLQFQPKHYDAARHLLKAYQLNKSFHQLRQAHSKIDWTSDRAQSVSQSHLNRLTKSALLNV